MTKSLQEVINRLKDLSEYSTTEIHKDWVQVVMSLFRQHLETSGSKQKYPILMFYCNWNLHGNLKKGIVQDILEKISKVTVDESMGHPADRISEILSLSRLRQEITDVLKESASIKSGVFDINENWKAFTELMFPFLLEKPLKRTRNPQTPYWVESLELYDNDGKLFWRIKTLPGNNVFSGPLLRTD